MTFRLVLELSRDGLPVAVTCRVLNVSRSGYYDWLRRPRSPRTVEDQRLTAPVGRSHADSRGTYGAPRVHADLRLGLGVRVGRKRIARLMRAAGLAGVCHRRKRGLRPLPATHDDLVQRRFVADRPDRVWFTDVTQHRASDGWVSCAAVVDALSRRVVGWSISDRITAEIVVDALKMARWQRRPVGTIVHSDRGSQYTSWVFGHRLRQAGLLGSMGRVASSVDNALMESFWSSMQRELLDRRSWRTRTELAARGMIQHLDVDDGERDLPATAFPGVVPVLGERSLPIRHAGPDLGAHTGEVLRELGWSDDRVADHEERMR